MPTENNLPLNELEPGAVGLHHEARVEQARRDLVDVDRLLAPRGGVHEVVARRSRFAKVLGLRVDLARVPPPHGPHPGAPSAARVGQGAREHS